MSDRQTIIVERMIAHAKAYLAHGPGIYDNQTWVLARGEGRVLLGGCGGQGVGIMWCVDSAIRQADPTYADAPYDPDRLDQFGQNGREPDDHA